MPLLIKDDKLWGKKKETQDISYNIENDFDSEPVHLIYNNHLVNQTILNVEKCGKVLQTLECSPKVKKN